MNKVGIELDVESGGFISGIASAERSVESLTQAMKKAKDEGRDEDFVRLQIQRDTLSASTSGFKRDTQKLFSEPKLQTTTANGATVLKMDADQAMSFKDLNTSIKKLTSVYTDQINDKDFKGASETFSQLQIKQGEFKKKVEEATTPAGMQSAKDALKLIGFNQIASAINDGFSRWVGSLDRSGIINQYGNGDILGGRIAEERRQANLVGGATQSVTSTVGAALMMSGNPYAMAGGALLSLGGSLFNTLLQKKPNEESTEAAYAGLWQQRSADAMNLAALMGNPNMVRETFKEAADAAAKFGYSAEEGMEMIGQAVKQGLNGDRAREVTEKVFNYERSTGADRGTLSSVSNMAARYGLGTDPLKTGWGGLGASGMSPGQYNEYLRALQRVMEDSIGKGFVKSADQVAANFTMLSQMTGNSPLWQGENGARRLSEMNAGLESATGLKSTSDIVAYRAAQNIARSQGKGGSYLDAMKIMEGGLTPNFFNEYMRLTKNIEGGNKEATVERMRQTFGLNYTNATALYEGWKPGMSDDSMKALVDRYKNNPLPNANGPELEGMITTEKIRNAYTEAGQIYFDKNFPKLQSEFTKAQDEIVKAINALHYSNSRAGQMEEEMAPLGPIAHGMAVQADRIMANQEAAQLRRDIEMARVSPDTMFFGGRVPRGSSSPTHTPFFNRNDNDDQYAYNRLMAYRDSDDPQAQKAFLQALDIMKTFSNEEKTKANDTNTINRAIPDVMTDKTGQQLLEELRNLKVNIHLIQQ